MSPIWFHLEPQCALEWPRMAITVPGEFHEASSRGRLIDRAQRTPLDNTPGHIHSRDGDDLCPSSDANPSRHRFRAHPLARWFAGRSQAGHGPATHGPQSLVSARALAFLQFIWHGNRHSTCLQDTLTCAMASICVHRATRTPPDSTPGHIRSRDD